MNKKIIFLTLASLSLAVSSIALLTNDRDSKNQDSEVKGVELQSYAPDKLSLYEDSDSEVIKWNKILLNAIAAEQVNPPEASRVLAILHRTVHFGLQNNPSISSDEDKRHFTEIASAQILEQFFPSFNQLANEEINKIDAEESVRLLATEIAKQAYQERLTDGHDDEKIYNITDKPGYWEATPPYFFEPLLPHWGDVDLFASSESDLEIDPPSDITSEEYLVEYNEVKDIGGVDSETRTVEQEEIAKYWADGKGTHTPPGHWNIILADVLEVNEISFDRQVEIYAVLNTAMADAGIGAWANKFEYEYWRPIDAIREADTDGNIATIQDSSWHNFIEAPNFPEYPSGHSAFSGAGATILTDYFGDSQSFKSKTLGLPGVSREFNSFWDAANEAGMSRIYGGIHFQSANVDGLELGRQVAEKAMLEVGR